MSSSLMWEPVRAVHGLYIRDPNLRLKTALKKRNDGEIIDIVLSVTDIAYLSGLRDAGVDGAEKLIKEIQKHESIRIWEKF